MRRIKEIKFIDGVVAIYEDEDGEMVEPVIGIAVVSDDGGDDEIKMFSIDAGGVSFCDEMHNFKRFALEEGEESTDRFSPGA